MSSPRILLPGVLVGALALGGCALDDDGPATTQTRDVGSFTRIDNSDSVDVRLRVGAPQRVLVRAGAKVIDDVGLEVRDGTLKIRFDHGHRFGDEVVVDLTAPRLTAVQATGSGDIRAKGIVAETFEVRADGSGDVVVEGTVGRLAVEVDGSGDADLAALVVDEARVFAGGSGDLRRVG